jgi:DNA-binding HxlR family transcriptional regulator
LTVLGESMSPIIKSMYDWGLNYQSELRSWKKKLDI